MWIGSWDSAGTTYTGTYTDAAGDAWVGTVTVSDTVAGVYVWTGAWHSPGLPV